MNLLPEKYVPWTFKPIVRRPPRPESADQHHPGFVQPLLQSMIRSKNSGIGNGIFAFTGPTPGTGVSYVVQVVARALALENRCRVLIGSSAVLSGRDGSVSRSYIERAPNVWSLVEDDVIDYLPEAMLDRVWIDLEPKDFDFVLIDCPALNKSGDALRLSQEVDGVFLVVAAGQTRRDQIDHAQKLLRYSGGGLMGLVLNRRTYPIPKIFYKFL